MDSEVPRIGNCNAKVDHGGASRRGGEGQGGKRRRKSNGVHEVRSLDILVRALCRLLISQRYRKIEGSTNRGQWLLKVRQVEAAKPIGLSSISTRPTVSGRQVGAGGGGSSLRRAQLPRIVQMVLVDRPVELEAVGQHNDGLRSALALIHRKSDRLVPVGEQAAAQAVGVLDDPMAGSVLPDEQAGSVCGAGRFDVLLDH